MLHTWNFDDTHTNILPKISSLTFSFLLFFQLKIQDYLSSTCHVEVDKSYTIIVYDASTTDASGLADDNIVSILGNKCSQTFHRVRVLYGKWEAWRRQKWNIWRLQSSTWWLKISGSVGPKDPEIFRDIVNWCKCQVNCFFDAMIWHKWGWSQYKSLVCTGDQCKSLGLVLDTTSRPRAHD